MNKTKIILLSIAVVLILVVFGVLGFNKKIVKAPTVTDANVATTTTSTIGQPSSFIVSSTASSTNSGLTVVISTSTTETAYTGPAFSFVYPKIFVYHPAIDFAIDTFGDKWVNGNVIPPGGAAVDVVTTTISSPVNDIVNTEILGATNIVTSTIVVDKISCEKATAQSNYAPGYTSDDIDVYCAKGSDLWKIYLSYGATDPAGAKHVSDFNGMLTSMKFFPW